MWSNLSMAETAVVVDFRLYVVGHAPNSERAIANLTALCRRHLPDRHRIEIVDVFEHPRRALDEGVMLTPLLVMLSARPVVRIVGDLTEPSAVLRALGIGST
jgi:circadian clock protein KaiB